jgi:hypothetical protein
VGKVVRYPSTGAVIGVGDSPFETIRVRLHEELTIIFSFAGYFAASGGSAFDPPMADANYAADAAIGPYKAIKDNAEVIIGFFDTGDHRLYLGKILIERWYRDEDEAR